MAEKPKPDRSVADAVASLKETVARIPDVLAAALGNVLGARRPGLAPEGTPADEARPAPADSGWGMFRSLFPSMTRYFARSEREARPGGVPASREDSLAAFLGRGNLDWRSFLSGTPSQAGQAISARKGPIGAQFVPGDVSADMEVAKAARAARKAMWGFGGHAAPSHSGQGGSYSARRWAALQAMMGQGPGTVPGATIGQPVPGQVFGRGWNPAQLPPRMPRPRRWRWPSWRRNPRPRRYWGPIIARHARSFGEGFAGGVKGLGSFYRAGRAAFASPRGAAAHRRRSQVASARFARGAAQAFGSGSSTFTRFSGAGQMAGASLAKLAGAAGLVASKFSVIAAGGQSLIGGFRALHELAEGRFDANRRFAMYNPAISGVYNQVALGDMRRNWQTAKENQGAIVTLARSVNAMRDALQPGEGFVTGLMTRAGIVGAGAVGGLGRLANRAGLDDLNRGMNAADPGGLNTEGWIDRKMQDVHGVYGYLYGGFEYIFNAIRGNPQGASMRDASVQAAQAWTEAERQAQLAAKLGGLPAWHASLDAMTRAGPFIPPKRVRRPGRRP